MSLSNEHVENTSGDAAAVDQFLDSVVGGETVEHNDEPASSGEVTGDEEGDESQFLAGEPEVEAVDGAQPGDGMDASYTPLEVDPENPIQFPTSGTMDEAHADAARDLSIIGASDEASTLLGELGEELIGDVIAAAERHEHYAGQETEEIGEGERPAVDPEADEATRKAAEKLAQAAKRKKEREEKAALKAKEREEQKAARAKEREEARAKKAAEKAAEPPKPARPTKTVFRHAGDRLKAALGDSWRETVVFTATDDDEVTTAEQDAFIEKMNQRTGPEGMADKVRDKAIMLFGWIKSGAGADALNEVMAITFRTLKRDGELRSGVKDGNLHAALLAKPYSLGTALAQGNQMFMLLPELKITVKEKGKMVPNPDSVLLPLIYEQMGL